MKTTANKDCGYWEIYVDDASLDVEKEEFPFDFEEMRGGDEILNILPSSHPHKTSSSNQPSECGDK